MDKKSMDKKSMEKICEKNWRKLLKNMGG